jgi:5-(carboxyamino)imidazole ribonucleotide synthase
MLGLAARELGYRVLVLDPDPDCPAAAVADRVEMGAYHDEDAARRLAERADVITYELEHVAIGLVDAVTAAGRPVRPGRLALQVTQDRHLERQFLERAGATVAPYRVVTDQADLAAAAFQLDLPLRLKAPTGGYDGRSQVRIAAVGDLANAIDLLGRPAGERLLLEKELPFEMELSVVVARDLDGATAAYPVGRNVHDEGILVESAAPAPIDPDVAARAQALSVHVADEIGLVGVMAAELFLMANGDLVVNELAPRVHNSGHWTIEAAQTSQFEQHIRAICGLPLGRPDLRSPAATVNLLGTGHRRRARLAGIEHALRTPDVHLHVYDKREVFERRKMGHVTALGATLDEALQRAARAALTWTGEG